MCAKGPLGGMLGSRSGGVIHFVWLYDVFQKISAVYLLFLKQQLETKLSPLSLHNLHPESDRERYYRRKIMLLKLLGLQKIISPVPLLQAPCWCSVHDAMWLMWGITVSCESKQTGGFQSNGSDRTRSSFFFFFFECCLLLAPGKWRDF